VPEKRRKFSLQGETSPKAKKRICKTQKNEGNVARKCFFAKNEGNDAGGNYYNDR
jgi:hypothetical protein